MVVLAVVGETDDRVLVDDAHGFTALVHDGAEVLVKPGRPQRHLAPVFVDIDHAALRTGVRRRVEVVDGCLAPVQVEDASESQAAQSRADDGDLMMCGHSELLSLGVLEIPLISTRMLHSNRASPGPANKSSP